MVKGSNGAITPQALLDRPDCPKEFIYLWQIFAELTGGDGLKYSEIDAYCRLMCVPLSPWEITVLFKLEETRHG